MIRADAAIDAHVEGNLDANIEALRGLCAIPSVGGHSEALEACAKNVASLFTRRGFSVELFERDGRPPIVVAKIGTGSRTILCYNPYDVQPPEPLELWTTPPFAPSLRDGAL